tara:strand:- start:120 stop:254 length:135 start_codon:yes stop_codon:yes gene_type:complete
MRCSAAAAIFGFAFGLFAYGFAPHCERGFGALLLWEEHDLEQPE